MTYGSWDINCNRYIFFVVLGHFLPFCHFLPFFAQKMKTSRKWRKHPRDIIILHKCTINCDYMLYCSWDMVRDGCNCYFSFWAAFCFYPSNSPKISKKMKKKKKKWLEISSFYTSVPKLIIICYTVPEIWCMMDVIVIFHFGLFFALLPLQQPEKWKFPKKWKKSWRYHHFTKVYQKPWLYATLLLRYDAWRM